MQTPYETDPGARRAADLAQDWVGADHATEPLGLVPTLAHDRSRPGRRRVRREARPLRRWSTSLFLAALAGLAGAVALVLLTVPIPFALPSTGGGGGAPSPRTGAERAGFVGPLPTSTSTTSTGAPTTSTSNPTGSPATGPRPGTITEVPASGAPPPAGTSPGEPPPPPLPSSDPTVLDAVRDLVP